MDARDILKLTDHTLLRANATARQLETAVEEAAAGCCASACIPPYFVSRACRVAAGRCRVTTVIGFPNGYNAGAVKLKEAETALADGADELDLVINLGQLCGGQTARVSEEIVAVKRLCGKRILKVIIETGLLDEAAKILACRIVSDSGADYIKTSTGYNGGAEAADIELIKRHIRPDLKIKASGGIRTLKAAEGFILQGCSRIGASALVAAAGRQL